jgi:hypothetical protein
MLATIFVVPDLEDRGFDELVTLALTTDKNAGVPPGQVVQLLESLLGRLFSASSLLQSDVVTSAECGAPLRSRGERFTKQPVTDGIDTSTGGANDDPAIERRCAQRSS